MQSDWPGSLYFLYHALFKSAEWGCHLEGYETTTHTVFLGGN